MTNRRLLSRSRAKKTTPAIAPTALGAPWQLQVAKAKFSEVFRRARADGPQVVTRGGTDAVVVVPLEQYELLLRRSRQPKSLVDFFRSSPMVGLDLNMTRDRDAGRDIDL